jgi:peptidyl-prolyl cis-trans isomerase B (cyclophilin B)
MEVVDEIADVKTDWHDRPYEDQQMKLVTAETFGIEYPQPIKA